MGFYAVGKRFFVGMGSFVYFLRMVHCNYCGCIMIEVQNFVSGGVFVVVAVMAIYMHA